MPDRTVSLLERSDATPFDVLDDALRAAGVEGAVQYDARFSEPWGFEVPVHGAEASFYLVLSGRCRLETDGGAAPLDLGPGDLAAVRVRHRLRDLAGSPTALVTDLDRSRADAGRPLRYGGGGAEAHLAIGCFAFDGAEGPALLGALPPVVHVPSQSGLADARLAATVRLIGLELEAGGDGAQAVVRHAAGTLFAQIVRSHLDRARAACAGGLRGHVGGWLAGLADPQLGPALTLVHQAPERGWTVAELGEAVGMSRTSFAVRFREVVGEPPQAYVRAFRLRRAATLLRGPSARAADVGHRVGYASEAAFARAFKRAHGETPGRYAARYRRTVVDG